VQSTPIITGLLDCAEQYYLYWLLETLHSLRSAQSPVPSNNSTAMVISESPSGSISANGEVSTCTDKKKSNAPHSMCMLKRERVGERRAAPTGSTSRRERRDEAAGTLSRVLGARTGAGRRLASKRERVALLPEVREGGRAGQGWGMGSSGRVSRLPRWQQLHLRAGVGRRCEAIWGTAARAARATSEGASRGGGGEGAAGSVSDRRRGGLGVQLAAV